MLTEIHQPEDAALVAERILTTLSQPLILHGHDVFITPSIGIALFPQDAQDVESLIKHADMAMYYAKRQGKHQYQFYNKEMNATAIRRMRLESCLRKALNQAELSLHYQPQNGYHILNATCAQEGFDLLAEHDVATDVTRLPHPIKPPALCRYSHYH